MDNLKVQMMCPAVTYRAAPAALTLPSVTTTTSPPAARRALAPLAAASLWLAACAPGPAAPRPSHDPTPDTTMTSNRILIALTSHDRKGATGQPTGAYLPEVAHPYAAFRAAGLDVDFASVRGGRVPLDGLDRPDEASAALLADEATMSRLHASQASSAVKASDYQAVFFAGGHGTMWDFPDDPGFQAVTAAIYEAGGLVGAVCHGPAALVNVKLSSGAYLVAGHTVSAFTNEEERAVKLDQVVPFLLQDRLTARGARFAPAPAWQPQVVVSDRLVTGQNPASAAAVAAEMVKLLGARPGR